LCTHTTAILKTVGYNIIGFSLHTIKWKFNAGYKNKTKNKREEEELVALKT
jgi:hypothetical protein